jgi:hypothetical protein
VAKPPPLRPFGIHGDTLGGDDVAKVGNGWFAEVALGSFGEEMMIMHEL